MMPHEIEEGAADELLPCRVFEGSGTREVFSNGSLLQSFLLRLAKRQPLTVPRDTRRYFISAREAAQICLIAATATPGQHVLVPRYSSADDLRLLELIAVQTLQHCGFEPLYLDDVGLALRSVAEATAKGRYPLVLTTLDTSGEKPYEEFLGEGEFAVEIGFRHLLATKHQKPPAEMVSTAVHRLAAMISDPTHATTKADIVATIASVVRGFRHRETGRSLDDRA